jgi:hypothetical protein
MSKNIAALSDGDLTTFKAALGTYGFLTQVSSGSIDTPVAYVDIALPTAFQLFELRLHDFQMDVSDLLAFAFSSDGGTTFHNDIDNFNSYNVMGTTLSAPLDAHSPLLSGYKGLDAVGIFTTSAADGSNEVPNDARTYGRVVSCMIFPGLAGRKASVLSFGGMTGGPTGYGPGMTFGRTYLETTGRQNLIRLLPLGNADVNPPTSGFNLVGGFYGLWGVPT